jgi:hypothetical protein
MDKLDAKTRPIGTLLSQEFFFRVPEYQRPFSWDADHFEDLIQDIITANREQEYFLGTIVLHHREEAGNYDVVDGQQRLTSLMILLACLRDIVQASEYKSGIQDKILQKKNVVDGIPEKVRLEVKDRKLFLEIVVSEGGTLTARAEDGLPEPEWRYVRAVNVFRAALNKLNQNEIQDIITFLNQKCVVIYLATSAFDDAFRLFTIVNDRGKQLRRIDILKAINIAPDVITNDTVRNKVAQEWEQTEKDLGESVFESVFHLVRLILLKDKPQSDLLKEFQNRIFFKKLILKGEPFFDLIFDYANLYGRIFIDRDFVPETAPEYRKWRALIHIMDSEFEASEWRACLVYYGKQFGTENFYAFCLGVEKIYLGQWVKGIRKDERFSEYAKLLAAIESAKKSADVLSGLQYDADAIRKEVSRQDIYSAGFGKYVLLRLELIACEHDRVHEFSAKSIEHVLPQNPDSTSDWAKVHNLSQIEEYVNSIGNLVLLSKSKNSAASNFDFDKKKSQYLKTRISDYPRSVEVLKYSVWDRATIDSRTQKAQEQVLQDP